MLEDTFKTHHCAICNH